MNNTNISPHLYVLTTFICAVIGLIMFYHYQVDEQLYFVPVLLLAVFHAAIHFARQCQQPDYYHIARNIKIFQLLRRAAARYIVWLVIIYAAQQLYLHLPYYREANFTAAHVFFEKFLTGYLIVGLPYFCLTLIFKASRIEDYYDPAIRLIHIVKQVGRRILHRKNLRSIVFMFRKQYNRKVLLILLVRAYFIPTMIIQVYSNLYNAVNITQRNYNDYDILSLLFFVSAMLWLMDTINASLAYAIESRWLENRPRSIDMTVSGWLVCLSCYAPLNSLTGTVFPWAPSVATGNPADLVITSLDLLYAVKIAEVLMLVAHIYTDVSLGSAVANITLRKLQTRGFYGIIRHPGTTLKLLYFLLSAMFYKAFWQVEFIFGYLSWAAIYIMRALTEERHLKHHAAYRDYMAKVKYRFIPYLF
jgi:protein-S-isoprenylcysteine O-methyltransferase Ste14